MERKREGERERGTKERWKKDEGKEEAGIDGLIFQTLTKSFPVEAPDQLNVQIYYAVFSPASFFSHLFLLSSFLSELYSSLMRFN